jgi:hypothetical protein
VHLLAYCISGSIFYRKGYCCDIYSCNINCAFVGCNKNNKACKFQNYIGACEFIYFCLGIIEYFYCLDIYVRKSQPLYLNVG